MAKNRRLKATTLLFRYLVLPTLFLCMIFHKQTFLQWIALGAFAIWLGAGAVALIRNIGVVKQINQKREKLAEIRAGAESPSTTESPTASAKVDEPKEQPPKQEMQPANFTARDLSLIRQVNYRVTELLKQTYPMITWLWIKRPSTEQLISGGTWRIQVCHTDPFNYAEVSMSAGGQLTITMLQATPLNEAQTGQVVSEDLLPGDILERVDVREWFSKTGEEFLTNMIDELNVQGHKKLLLRENGEVLVQVNSEDKLVDTIPGLPPRMTWDEFCTLLKEDDILAEIKPEGLRLAW